MKKLYSFMDSLRRSPSFFCALSLTFFLNSCASTSPKRQRTPTPEVEESRSELVFLNIEEASGWVAYNCNPSEVETETETYRIVVIRQKSGEIIYDSQIPLAADLCTHGFEMSPEDPRLKKIGRNVDNNIIEPLEAYQKSLKAETTTPASEKKPEPVTEAKPVAQTSPEKKIEASPTPTATVESAPQAQPEVSAITIIGMEDDLVLLDLNDEKAPSTGDRFFLRTSPEIIAIPGTDEKIITSEGEVTGLVKIRSVENGTARAEILSGIMPESGVAEKVSMP